MIRKKIGVLGGSFDPVHKGHVTLGEAAVMEAGLEKLIVMPAHVQPFKIGRNFADDEHRLAMCRLAFENVERAEISDYEIVHTDISYTFDTLAHLKKVFPDSKLYFITGTDSFLEIEHWRKGKDLLQTYGFIVSVRPGYREKQLEECIRYYETRYGTDIIRLHYEMPDVSSTAVKLRRQEKQSVSHMLPESVERYINEHGLYL